MSINSFAMKISNFNILVLFGIIKYLLTGYSGDSKFAVTVFLDVNLDKS